MLRSIILANDGVFVRWAPNETGDGKLSLNRDLNPWPLAYHALYTKLLRHDKLTNSQTSVDPVTMKRIIVLHIKAFSLIRMSYNNFFLYFPASF